MELEKSLYKAEHLLKQKRYKEAHQEVTAYLATDPESVPALIILTQIYLGMDQEEKADEVAGQLVRRSPADPAILFVKGLTQVHVGKRKSALKYLNSVLTFDPMRPDAHGLISSIHFQEADFEKALEAANAGLAIDPQNELCLNYRSMALLRLNRTEEHRDADRQALKSNPMNPLTHASVGYSSLQKGEYRQAKDHFREALHLDPENEYARHGMLNAIRATNVFYRLFLKYAFWMQGLKPQVRWAVIIIGYLLMRGLNDYSEQLGAFKPFADVIVTAYLIFAVSTWIIEPVSNIFLRFHRFGRYVLKEKEIRVANICAGLLIIALAGAVGLYVFSHQVQWYNLSLYLLCVGIALTVIVSSIANRSLERSKRRLRTAGAFFAVGCVILIVSAVILPVFALKFFTWVIYGFIGYQFYANAQE